MALKRHHYIVIINIDSETENI